MNLKLKHLIQNVRRHFRSTGCTVGAETLVLARHADRLAGSGNVDGAVDTIAAIYALHDDALNCMRDLDSRSRQSPLTAVVLDATRRPVPWGA